MSEGTVYQNKDIEFKLLSEAYYNVPYKVDNQEEGIFRF